MFTEKPDAPHELADGDVGVTDSDAANIYFKASRWREKMTNKMEMQTRQRVCEEKRVETLRAEKRRHKLGGGEYKKVDFSLNEGNGFTLQSLFPGRVGLLSLRVVRRLNGSVHNRC